MTVRRATNEYRARAIRTNFTVISEPITLKEATYDSEYTHAVASCWRNNSTAGHDEPDSSECTVCRDCKAVGRVPPMWHPVLYE